jgi:UDP-N-acetylmuramoyl-L-alanyl-D-glutamate--2,6-diaminopimelate ligase
MEEINNSQGFRIIIDFAHTPNALYNLLLFLKKQLTKKNKLVVVFGCAGERDIKKRPLMGKIAMEIADISIFTAEDPRRENVEKIISQIEKGAKKAKSNHKYLKIKDRGEAISYAIQNLVKKGDIIAICGKGHEKSIAYNGVEYPWSDQMCAKEVLNGLKNTK